MTNRELSERINGGDIFYYDWSTPVHGTNGDDSSVLITYNVSPSSTLGFTINGSPVAIDGNKNMTLKEKFALAITSEPQKSFRKAGITNGDNLLTDEGEKIFLSWLLSKNADAFKAEVVDKLLEEEK